MSLPGWNYRVCKERFHYKIGKRRRSEVVFSLREVHYDKKGKERSWSADPTTIVGGNQKEVVENLTRALHNAVLKPVLWIGNTRKPQ